MMASKSNKGKTHKTEGVFATLDCFETDTAATFDVAAFNYPSGDSDLEATIAFNGLEVAVGMTPEQARELRDDLGAALDEVADE